jgi:hypothetical protein
MKIAHPTTYLTADELSKMASIKLLDANSGKAGARRDGLLEEANALQELVKVRKKEVQ